MEVYIDDNNLVIIEPKTFHFHFDLHKNVDKNVKHEIDSAIKHNGLLAEERIKNEIDQLLFKYKHGNKFMNIENSKMSEPRKFVLSLPQRLDLKKLRQMYCSSKLTYLLHLAKYNTTVQKQ